MFVAALFIMACTGNEVDTVELSRATDTLEQYIKDLTVNFHPNFCLME